MPKVLRKLRNGPIIEVDAQIILWRKRRLKKGLKANGKPIEKKEKTKPLPDNQLRNIFSFEGEE